MTSPITFLGTAPDTPAAKPATSFFRKTPVDPVGYLPETSRTRLSLLRAAKRQAESALEIAVDAGVTDEFLGGLREERAVTASNLLSVEQYVSSLHAPVEALPAANVSKLTIDGVRAEIAAVEQRWTALQIMRPTKSEQIERLRLTVAGTASTLAPEAFRLARENWVNPIDPAMALREILGLKGDPLALMCAIFPDAIVTRLSETIAEDPEGALPAAERKEAIEQARAELLRLGWAEETLIRQAATPPLRRSTALPECLLGSVAR